MCNTQEVLIHAGAGDLKGSTVFISLSAHRLSRPTATFAIRTARTPGVTFIKCRSLHAERKSSIDGLGIIKNALFSPRTGTPPSTPRASPATRRSWSVPRRRKLRLQQAKTGTDGWGGAPQILSVEIVGFTGMDE
jgi:hypothetical protein